MLKEISVNLANFLLSLSDAVDLASPSIASHQMRTAFIVWQIGSLAKLPGKTIERIFMAALLHDVGALAPEDKIRLHEFEEQNLQTHCIRGESLFNMAPLLRPAAKIVRHHHRPWRAWNVPIDAPDVLESQILFLADYIERLVNRNGFILHQVDSISSKITSMAGSEIHPDVTELYAEVAQREDFWLDLTSPRLYSLLLHFGPFCRVEIQVEEIYSLSLLFRSIIDFRSSFTATHSTGVATCAATLSEIFGLTETEVALMEIAGNLHDLGKLAVPNYILNKPGKLTRDEFAVIKQHTYFTYTILNTIGGMDQISEWAAFHHEKLDGTGYPFHVSAEKLSTGSRIMAVADIFTALVEDRPYRKGMERKEIEKILRNQARQDMLDYKIVNLLLENYEELSNRVKEQQARSMASYQDQFV